MKWIPREKVKVDRVACPWLIKRFIDPDAEFFFVPADRIVAEAERLGATPFDTPGANLNHRGRRLHSRSCWTTTMCAIPPSVCLGKLSAQPTLNRRDPIQLERA